MVQTLRILALVALVAFFAADGSRTTAQVQEERFPARGVGASQESLHSLFDTYWEWRLATQPELATRVGRAEFNDRWRDLSKRARDR